MWFNVLKIGMAIGVGAAVVTYGFVYCVVGRLVATQYPGTTYAALRNDPVLNRCLHQDSIKRAAQVGVVASVIAAGVTAYKA